MPSGSKVLRSSVLVQQYNPILLIVVVSAQIFVADFCPLLTILDDFHVEFLSHTTHHIINGDARFRCCVTCLVGKPSVNLRSFSNGLVLLCFILLFLRFAPSS